MSGESRLGADFGVAIYHGVELLFKQGIVVTSVKVKYPGIDPLMMVSAKTTEGPKIAFIGGRSLDQIGKVFLGFVRSEALEWREDQFTLERLATSEDS